MYVHCFMISPNSGKSHRPVQHTHHVVMMYPALTDTLLYSFPNDSKWAINILLHGAMVQFRNSAIRRFNGSIMQLSCGGVEDKCKCNLQIVLEHWKTDPKREAKIINWDSQEDRKSEKKNHCEGKARNQNKNTESQNTMLGKFRYRHPEHHLATGYVSNVCLYRVWK